MQSSENIILTGFMATGKTTVGKILANRLKREFIDTDRLIEERQGRSIAEIFRTLGEPAFRHMEADIARELGKKEGLVISTGGRLMLDPANVTALTRTGRVFCLVASPQKILARLQGDTANHRPLLDGPNPNEQIAELLHAREMGYRRFLQISTDDRSPQDIAADLLELLAAKN